MSNIIQIKHGASDPTPQILQPYELGYKEKEGLYINDGGVVRPVWGQSDYQQNDSTAADFIKNRTHYIATETEELVNGKLFFSNSFLTQIENFILKTGSKYRVFFDGGEYECVAFDIISEGEVFQAIGNIFLMNGEPSLTNEPFLFLYRGEGWYSNFEYYLPSFNIEHIVSIYSIEDNNMTLLQDKILFLDSGAYVHKAIKIKFNTEIKTKEEKYQICFNGEEFNLSATNNDELESYLPLPYFFVGSEDKDQYLENGIPFGVYGLLGFNEAFLEIAAWNISQPDWYNIEIRRTYSFIEPINPQYLPEEGVGYSKIKNTNENFDLVEVIDKLIENSDEYEYIIDNDEVTGKKYIYGDFYVTELPFEILPNEKYEILLNGKEYKTNSIIADEEFYAFGDIICSILGLYDDVHIIVAYDKINDYQFGFSLTIDMEYFGLEDFPKEMLIKKIAQEEEIHQINEKYIPYIQQDWNENNPESRSYIANRTHWIEKHRTIVLDWLSRNSWSGEGIIYWNNYPIISYLEEGKEYIVAVSSEYECENAIEYRCKCQKYNDESLLLGEDLYESYPNNQYPFGIYIHPDGECSITTTENIRWISISYETEIIHKIDKKFLPEGTGGSGVSSWNDLTDKPFYEEFGQIVISKPDEPETFSLLLEGNNLNFCKISDLTFTKEQLIGCIITNEKGEQIKIEEESFMPEEQSDGMIVIDPGILIVYNQYVSVIPESLYFSFPSTGIWIHEDLYDEFKSIEYNGQVIHPLDEKFIPDSIARKKDVKKISWNNLVDKPFDKPLTYSWDVNTIPLEVVHWQGYEVHKINGYSPTAGDFAGGKVGITYINSSGTQKEELFIPEMDSLEWEESIEIGQSMWGKGWWSIGDAAIIVTEEEAIINTDLILSKGFWICVDDSLTEFILSGKYGHIYEDFIPDTIARLEDVTLKPARSFGYYDGLSYLEKIELEDWQSGDPIVLYKISDEAIPYYNFFGGSLNAILKSQIAGGTEVDLPAGAKIEYNLSVEITEDNIRFTEGGYSIEGIILVVTDKSISLEGEEFSRGIWVQDTSYLETEITEDSLPLQMEYYARLEQEVIDEQIIPKTIARTSESVKSWNDLKDIPFGKKKYEFILGAQYETATNGSLTFSKITNHTPNLEELYHGSFIISINAESAGSVLAEGTVSIELPIIPEVVYQYDGYFAVGAFSEDVTTGGDLGTFVVVTDDSVKIQDIELTHGTWFIISEDLGENAKGSIYLTKPLYFETIDEEYFPSTTPKIEKASVGQVVVIKSVDKNGKPTAWEAIDPWIVQSSTAGSNKKFRLSVDDSGAITATEVT